MFPGLGDATGDDTHHPDNSALPPASWMPAGEPRPEYDPVLRFPRYRAKATALGVHSGIEPEPELTDLFRDYLTEKGVPPRQVDQLRQTFDELLAGADRERIRASASSLATRCRPVTGAERRPREPLRGPDSFRRGRV